MAKRKNKKKKPDDKRTAKRKNEEWLDRSIARDETLKNMPRANAAVEVYKAAQIRTLREYQDELRRKGLAITKEYADGLNVIDMRGCWLLQKTFDPETGPGIMRDVVPDDIRLAFYRCVPCFTEGILLLDIMNGFDIYFKIKKLDTENLTLSLHIQTYQPDDDAGYLLARTEDIILYGNPEDGQCYVEETKIQDRHDTCTLLSVSRMGWHDTEKAIWKEFVKSLENPERKDSTVYSWVLNAMAVANYVMEQAETAPDGLDAEAQDRPGGKPKKPAGAGPVRVRRTAPDQVVHEYDGLKIIYKAGRVTRRSGGRNYVTPVWTVKGHVRKYKSGKICYVRPTVRHRKSLTDSSDKKAPKSVVKIK